MDSSTKMKWFSFLCCIVFAIATGNVIGEPVDIEEPTKTEARLKLEEKAKEEKKEEKKRIVVEISPEEISKLDLPEDTTALMTAKELRFIGNLRQCGYRLRYGPGTLIPPKVIAAISTMNGQTITTQAINYKLRTQALAGTCCGHLRYGFVEMVKNHWPDGFQRFMGSVSNASTGKM